MGLFCSFQKIAQRKQAPIGRKFGQSGHPGKERKNQLSADLQIS
jgi:hypothetical protein